MSHTPDETRPTRSADATALALDRTRLAYERTLMAWVRTGLSLISFGFAIYKFFNLQGLRDPTQEGLIGARIYGFLMIAIGLFALLFASFQHRQDIRSLRAMGAVVPRSLALMVAGLVSVLGILGLLAVIFRQ